MKRQFTGDILARLQGTQCCDPVIDGLLGAAIQEIQRQRVALRRIGELSHAGEGDTVDDAVEIARATLENCP